MIQERVFSICTELPAYRAALAELPLSAAPADDVRGTVAVVPGTGDWWQSMLAALAVGALAVVLADPTMLPRGAVEPDRWPLGMPVIVERPRLRPDVVSDAVRARRGSPARMVTVECAAPSVGLDDAILDGCGWARSLIGGPLSFRAGIATAQGSRIALLDSGGDDGSIPATLMATPVGGFHGGGLLQVLALGEVRTEVTVDQPAGLNRVETVTEEGTLRHPERYESSARLALRRAMEACSSGEPAADLHELFQDMALTWALLDA